MKSTLRYLLFLFACNSFAQITLEHTYNNSAVTRIKLEYSGEKYYEFNTATNELIFYNDDHTLWKIIVLPAPLPNALSSPAQVIHVSDSKLNIDASIEIIFEYYNFSTNKFDCKIISENGTTMLTIPEAWATLNEIPGLLDKLIVSATGSTKVYSVPELVLENTYTYENIRRIKLENSSEKHYFLDKVNNNAIIYNSNHSLWKTVNLPKPNNDTYTDIDFISETKINPDALLEIGYSYYETVGNITTYSSKIVNENNLELISVPNSRKLQVSSIEGLQDKLIAELPIDFFKYNTNIYNLPSLTIEKGYESAMTRVKLENSGEKYFTSSRPLNNQVKIYNSNHSLWKTIDLSTGYTFLSNNVTTVSSLSESKINSDALIELLYTYETGLLGYGYEYSSRVINENGDVLLDAGGLGNLILSTISGSQNKLIGANFNHSYGNTGFVFSLGNLSISDFTKKPRVVIAPNPAKSFIYLNSLSSPIIKATIYNMSGILVKKETAQNITKIDVDKLPMGIYIVNLTDFNNQKSTHKITISH